MTHADLVKLLRFHGYTPNVTVVVRRQHYRLQFANRRTRRAIEIGGRQNAHRDAMLKHAGWRVEKWPARLAPGRRTERPEGIR